MAGFITANGAAHYIEQILTGAMERLTLVSPNLRLSDVSVQRLQGAAERRVSITLVHQKDALHPAEREKLRTVRSRRVLALENRQAKCYASEREMVITSKSLYSSSWQNWERQEFAGSPEARRATRPTSEPQRLAT